MKRFGLLPEREGQTEEVADPHRDVQTGEPPGLQLPTVVEFGAGKGWLSFMLNECWGAQSIILVDNRGFTNKADKSMREIHHLARVTIDMKDLDIGKCPGVDQGQEWIALGKHCCGASTDYGLRCSIGQSGRRGLVGLAIAPCCHHRCGWRAYVGKRSMQKWGFSPAEFELISWMTGWALCGHGSLSEGKATSLDKEEEDSSPAGKRMRCVESDLQQDAETDGEPCANQLPFIELARETKQRVGAMAKRLIDAGRLDWLKASGCVSEAVVYTSESGENRLILAKPPLPPTRALVKSTPEYCCALG